MGRVLRKPDHPNESAREMAMRLPFKVGEDVEVKSFIKGFRGAWFVCKILDVSKGSNNQLRYKLKYRDFEDEPLHWTQAYQQRYRRHTETTELMVRPLPPDVGIMSEEDLREGSHGRLKNVPSAWEVRASVDWTHDNVWWECTVIAVDKEKVQISILTPPQGEGGIHWVDPKHLRSSLVWSPSDSWSIATSKVEDVNGQVSGPSNRSLTRGQLLGPAAKQRSMRVKSGSAAKSGLDNCHLEDETDVVLKTAPLPEILQRAMTSVHMREENKPEREISSTKIISPSNSSDVITLSTSSETISLSTDEPDKLRQVEINEALRMKNIEFKRRMLKFIRYRKHIRRAVEFLRDL